MFLNAPRKEIHLFFLIAFLSVSRYRGPQGVPLVVSSGDDVTTVTEAAAEEVVADRRQQEGVEGAGGTIWRM